MVSIQIIVLRYVPLSQYPHSYSQRLCPVQRNCIFEISEDKRQMYNAETNQAGLTVAVLCYPISKYASQIEHLPCKKDAAHIPVSLQLYNIPHLVH